MRAYDRDKLLFLGEIQRDHESYHNHKEAVAWGAIVLYTFLTVHALATLGDSSGSDLLEGMLTTLFLVTLFFVTAFFVRAQFRLRSRAACLVAAALLLRSEMLSGQRNELDLSVSRHDVTNRDMQSSHSLPAILLEEADRFETRGAKSIRRLERGAWAFIIATLLFSLSWVWLPHLRVLAAR